MSNTTQLLKAALVQYLEESRPDESINVVDAVQRAEIELPTLAVAVPSVEAHSPSLCHVMRADVEITLRVHAGDDESSIDSWMDQLENLLNDPSTIKAEVDDGIQIDYWLFQGVEQDWSESVFEAVFSAQCLVIRL